MGSPEYKIQIENLVSKIEAVCNEDFPFSLRLDLDLYKHGMIEPVIIYIRLQKYYDRITAN